MLDRGRHTPVGAGLVAVRLQDFAVSMQARPFPYHSSASFPESGSASGWLLVIAEILSLSAALQPPRWGGLPHPREQSNCALPFVFISAASALTAFPARFFWS